MRLAAIIERQNQQAARAINQIERCKEALEKPGLNDYMLEGLRSQVAELRKQLTQVMTEEQTLGQEKGKFTISGALQVALMGLMLFAAVSS